MPSSVSLLLILFFHSSLLVISCAADGRGPRCAKLPWSCVAQGVVGDDRVRLGIVHLGSSHRVVVFFVEVAAVRAAVHDCCSTMCELNRLGRKTLGVTGRSQGGMGAIKDGRIGDDDSLRMTYPTSSGSTFVSPSPAPMDIPVRHRPLASDWLGSGH